MPTSCIVCACKYRLSLFAECEQFDGKHLHLLYIALVKVPALSCRLGHVPYDRAFGALMSGCAPYDRAFGVLIVRSLSIKKKFDQQKNWYHGNQTCTLCLVNRMRNQHSTLDIHRSVQEM